jgi:hypothetical protein
MAIRLDCPRCKQNLLVPNKKAGGYASCPRCGGRFWVPSDATADSAWTDTVTLAAGSPRPQESAAGVATPPVVGGVAGPPLRSPAPSAPPRPAMAVPPPAPPPTSAPPLPPGAVVSPSAARPAPAPPAPPAARSGRRVARLISAEAAQSALKPAADGRLPDLQLQEGQQKQRPESTSRSINPLLLFGLLSLSVVMSVVIVLLDVDTPRLADSAEKNAARLFIEDNYFGGGNLDQGDLKRYQIELREARRAHSRGDDKTERRQYRRVLDLLHAERGEDQRGLTGSRDRDNKLEKNIRTILSGT